MSSFLGVTDRPNLTGEDIKAGYEAQPNTNEFSDAEKQKLKRVAGSIAEMALIGDLLDGQNCFVLDAGETFTYIAGSTLTADGALVVDAAGMGAGRLISTQKRFDTDADMLADFRTFAAGTKLTAGGHSYEATAGTGSLGRTNAGGQGFDVLPGADGAYNIWAFGVPSDGITDASAALEAVADFSASQGGLTFLFPPGEYIWDGRDLVFGDGFTILGWGATLKLAAGSYSGNMYGVTNRVSTTYNAGNTTHQRIRVFGLKIDGNYANVSHTGSMCGLYFHQADDVIIDGVEVVDLPGATNGLPGLDFFFCDDVSVRDYQSENTGRQGILFWGSTGRVSGGSIGYSRERESILASSENTPAYQGSHVVIENVTMDNSGTTNGTRCVRFSGKSSGVVRSCQITGSASVVGAYVTYSQEHIVTIEDNDFFSCEYGLLVETDGPKTITFENNRLWSCVDGIRWLAAGTDTRFECHNNLIDGTTTAPLYVAYCEHVSIKGNTIRNGGSSNVLLSNFVTLQFCGNVVSDMTSAAQSVNISSVSSGSAIPIVSNNIVEGNTADVITTTVNVLAENNNLENFIGAGIKLGRVGRSYVWASSSGKLYTKTSLPATETDGTVVGTQT